MTEYLIFQLYGPLAAWGTVAVGEIRPVSSYPSRSGVLGLLAAAMGIRRHDADGQTNLSDSLYIGIMELNRGSLLVDYHTVQAPDRTGSFTYRTRRDSVVVGRDRLSALQTRREYRCDAVWQVALWCREASTVDLSSIADSLRRPKFVPYLGRKSCPVAAPMRPQIVVAEGLVAAFDQADFPGLLPGDASGGASHRLLGVTAQRRYHWEGDGGDIAPAETSERFDSPVSWQRRQFRPRLEHSSTKDGSS